MRIDSTFAEGEAPIFTSEQIAEEPNLWPSQVLLRQPATLLLTRDGSTTGSIVLPAGRLVDVTAVGPETVHIRYGSATAAVLVAHTDLRERATNSQALEQLQMARMALIEESLALVAPAPTPTPVAEASPEPVLPSGFIEEEFEDKIAFKQNWRSLAENGEGRDPLGRLSVESDGELEVLPEAGVWDGPRRAGLMYREVQGDFIATSAVTVLDRTGRGPPSNNYAFGGLLVCIPGETEAPASYVSTGLGNNGVPDKLQAMSESFIPGNPPITKWRPGVAKAEVAIARVDSKFFSLLREPSGIWSIIAVYDHPDLPKTLQVGFTAFASQERGPSSSRATRRANPDLQARFDYVNISPIDDDMRQRFEGQTPF